MSQLLWEVILAEILEGRCIILPFILSSCFLLLLFLKIDFLREHSHHFSEMQTVTTCWVPVCVLRKMCLSLHCCTWEGTGILHQVKWKEEAEVQDAGGSGILEELYFLMCTCAWAVGAFIFFCISTRITTITVTAFCQLRRAGHNKHFSVSGGSSNLGVGCTHHVGVSESCSVGCWSLWFWHFQKKQWGVLYWWGMSDKLKIFQDLSQQQSWSCPKSYDWLTLWLISLKVIQQAI